MSHGYEEGEISSDDASRSPDESPQARHRADGAPAAPDRYDEPPEGRQRGASATAGVEDDREALARRDAAARAEEPVDGVLEDPEQNPTGYLVQAEHWSAPTPSPKAIQAYENISPGLGIRAFDMAEKALETQNAVTSEMVRGDVKTLVRGQWMSFTLMLICILGAAYMAVNNQPVVAVAMLGYPVFQGVSKLIRTVYERPSDKNEPPEADE